ncbi:unnamed protein product [Closterium sp. Yama58-4]|nr:unnamed protein product [Closterium sp. Yama58-4]
MCFMAGTWTRMGMTWGRSECGWKTGPMLGLAMSRSFGDKLAHTVGVTATPDYLNARCGPMLGLAMSRSLRDKHANTVEVTATPEVVVRRLDQSDAFLVLGSDGLWEYVGDDEAIGVVVAAGSIEAGVKALLALAKERWLTKDGAGYVDDITALVVGFTHRKV